MKIKKSHAFVDLIVSFVWPQLKSSSKEKSNIIIYIKEKWITWKKRRIGGSTELLLLWLLSSFFPWKYWQKQKEKVYREHKSQETRTSGATQNTNTHTNFQWKVKWIDRYIESNSNVNKSSFSLVQFFWLVNEEEKNYERYVPCTVYTYAKCTLAFKCISIFVDEFFVVVVYCWFSSVLTCVVVVVIFCLLLPFKSNLNAVEFNQAHCVTTNECQDIFSLARAIFHWTQDPFFSSRNQSH